jgi:hypothetical protein
VSSVLAAGAHGGEALRNRRGAFFKALEQVSF